MLNNKRIILGGSGGGAGGESSVYGLSRIFMIAPAIQDKVCAYFGSSVFSIPAAYLANGGRAEQCYQLIREHNQKVFTKNSWISRHFRRAPRYKSDGLHSVLISIFGEKRMCDLEKDCYITAYRANDDRTDMRHRRVKVFTRADKVKVVDAIMASCAAPWFFGTWEIDGIKYGDGGVVDNLAADIALSYQHKETGLNPDNFKVMSIITGGMEKGERKAYKSGSFFSLLKKLPGQLLPADIDGEILKVDNWVGECNHLVIRPPLDEYGLDDVKIQKKLTRQWGKFLGNKVVQSNVLHWYEC